MTEYDVYNHCENNKLLLQYKKEISQYQPLSNRETLQMLRQRNDLEIKQKLINHHLYRVIPIAMKYWQPGMDILDLIQEGNIGLLRAIDNFDENKGKVFTIYAKPWIESLIARYVNSTINGFHLPENRLSDLKRYHLVYRYLEKKLKKSPSTKDMAMEFGVDEDVILGFERILTPVLSIDTSVDEKTEMLVRDIVSDELSNTEEIYEQKELYELLNTLIDTLPPKYGNVLRQKYGLDDGIPKSLEAIKKENHCGRSTVYLHQTKGLDLLRDEYRKRKLRSYVE